jgi:hypothetical protein
LINKESKPKIRGDAQIKQGDLISLLSCSQNKENRPKMDLCGLGCEYMDWIQLAQDRVQWWASVKNL